MTKRLISLSILLLLFAVPVLAQESGGQFWVQAFEDRNANGVRDPGEPFLTSGVSVDLLNAEGVVMASGTLEGAPYATQGFIGFQYLPAGNYTAVITSPDLTPTTPDRVDVTISEGEPPVAFMYGAQNAVLSEPAAAGSETLLVNPEIARVALAGFGAMLVVGVMIALGVAVYVFVLRRRAPVEAPTAKRTTTGSMRAVRVDETGAVHDTGEFRPPERDKNR